MTYMLLKRRLKGFARLLVLGIGNESKGDDAAGIEFARRLKRQIGSLDNVSIVEAGIAPENSTWVVRSFHPSHILIVDAAEMGMAAGCIRIVERSEIDSLSFCTHSLSLSFLANYLEKEFGSKVIIVGIEPSNLDFGKKISGPVMEALRLLVRTVLEIVSK